MRNRSEPHAVFLVGFMGAGKTSVGQALARRLGWRFCDLDRRIEAREQRTVAEIFHTCGESAFRRAESAALRALLRELKPDRPVVAALGGGAFVQTRNARLLARARLPVVFLDAPVEVLRRRCRRAGPERPLFEDAGRFRELHDLRRPSYLRADLRVRTATKSVPAVAAEIQRRLRLARHITPGV